MASTIIATSIFIFILFPSFFSTHTANSEEFSRILPMKLKQQKVTHLHFYFHDVISGRNATVVQVAGPSNFPTTGFGFGTVMMMDDLLTDGPEPTSRPIGRAQGIYASAGQQELGFLMVMNLAFTDEKYNGSVLSVVGRNQVLHPVREMPVIGGSGLFRFARGYAQAQTLLFDPKTGRTVVEYNVYVMHY